MTRSVVVVDDSKEFRTLMALLIQREAGAICHGLSSLAEVMASQRQVLDSELVIIDINLGADEPDGVAVYEWLCAQSYAGNVFFFTGHAQDSPQVIRAAQTGVRILEKPLSARDIILLIQQALTGASEAPKDVAL